MADPKHPARHLSEPIAKGHVVPLEDDLTEGVGVMAVGHQDSGQGVAVFPVVPRTNLEAPSVDGATCRLTVPRYEAAVQAVVRLFLMF